MEPQTPLSNTDFRKLLAQPRTGPAEANVVSFGGATPAVGSRSDSGGFARPVSKADAAADRKKKEKASRWREIQEKRAEEQKEHDSKYRDRAKERREMTQNPDYEEEQFDEVGELFLVCWWFKYTFALKS